MSSKNIIVSIATCKNFISHLLCSPGDVLEATELPSAHGWQSWMLEASRMCLILQFNYLSNDLFSKRCGLKDTCFCIKPVSCTTPGLFGKIEGALFIPPKSHLSAPVSVEEVRRGIERDREEGWRLSIRTAKANSITGIS